MKKLLLLCLCLLLGSMSLAACKKTAGDADAAPEQPTQFALTDTPDPLEWTAYDPERQKLDEYFWELEESGEYAVIKDDRCVLGYELLTAFYNEVSHGKAATLKYMVCSFGEPIKTEGTLSLLDPNNERRRVGTVSFDGERFIDSGTDHFPEKREYSFESAYFLKEASVLESDDAAELGCDRMECYYMTNDKDARFFYFGDTDIGKLALGSRYTPTPVDESDPNAPHGIAAIKVGWGEDKRLSGEIMRFSQGADIESTIAQIRNEGYVVVEEGKCTAGYERLREFYENAQQGVAGTLKYASCYEGESTAYGKPSLYLSVLDYDGEYFTHITRGLEESEIDRPSRFRFFKCDRNEASDGSRLAAPEYYYLVNDETKTHDDIMRAIVSSDSSVAFAFAWDFVISIYE